MSRLFDPHAQALDASGDPLAGATLTTYRAGTTTPVAAFLDEAATTPATNPVIADASGTWPPLYLADGIAYRLRAASADGAVIFDVTDRPMDGGGADVGALLTPTTGVLENGLRAVCLIPGAGEFAYATTNIIANGVSVTRELDPARANIDVALDQLLAAAPGVQSVTLVVAWFGDDLRANQCDIRPKVDDASKTVTPWDWQVSGVTRATSTAMTQSGGGPAFGGTPADRSVVEAITAIKARGLKVTLLPFLLMDIRDGNTKPDPYGGSNQAAYPWRGRITCFPAAGQPSTADKTAAAATQVSDFFGAAAVSEFTWDGDNFTAGYTGASDEWGYRRFILHYARLAKEAGGVEAFLIGSEMVGLTQVRSDAATYPAITQLRTLVSDVRGVLGAGTLLSYAADWSEYHSHRPADGSGDVLFNMDPLWADDDVDFIGIDFYMPLADWRDGTSHTDYALAKTPYVQSYLQGNVEGGEDYDWFYASEADRTAQTRTTIDDTDPADEDWVFRQKDLRNWWLNPHHNRPAGSRASVATAWTAQSKPIWFTEFGAPAVDKAMNEPNVFYDPKSAESGFPRASSGKRDDAAQRAVLDALIAYWDPAAGNNPISASYAASMITWDRMAAWTWDARPRLLFPERDDLYADAANWWVGHWINGRIGRVTLADLLDPASSINTNANKRAGAGVYVGELGALAHALDAGPLGPWVTYDSVSYTPTAEGGRIGHLRGFTTTELGDAGSPANLQAGKVPGYEAYDETAGQLAVATGSTRAAAWNASGGGPKGDKGDKGDPGDDGTDGADGTNVTITVAADQDAYDAATPGPTELVVLYSS